MAHARPQDPPLLPRLAFAALVFLAAFLLFQVQLIAAKYLLPWFGGSAAVWTTCLLLFQVLLLLGYGYAHIFARMGRGWGRLHPALLLLSVLVLAGLGFRWATPITPAPGFLLALPNDPILSILAALSASVGLPFLLLATTSPLLQDLYVRAQAGRAVYRLYALSNAGSLAGLVTYPFLVEPWITLRHQSWLWSAGYAAVALGTAALVLALGRRVDEAAIAPAPGKASARAEEPPAPLGYALWLVLAACGTSLLLAVTNYLCQDLAVVPLLWVLPLALYLLSFVLTFQSDRLYRRDWAYPLLALATAAACYALLRSGFLSIRAEIGIFSLALLAGCLVCHGELSRSRPPARYLTAFYLMIALGGAVGTAFVSLLAPVIFYAVWEFHFALGLCALLAVAVLLLERDSWLRRAPWPAPLATLLVGVLPIYAGLEWADMPAELARIFRWAMLLLAVLAVIAFLLAARRNQPRPGSAWARFTLLAAPLLLGFFLWQDAAYRRGALLLRERNFYGVLTVWERFRGDPVNDAYELYHGRILHGLQLRNPEYRRRASAYYGNSSGVGLVLRFHARRWDPRPEQTTLRVGALGLGTGTILIYGAPGDYFRVYELDPAVVALTQGPDPYFSYLRDCRGQTDIVLGDARFSLQREADAGRLQQFDVLVLDAFSGDAIPVHLLTREAFALYLRHLRDDHSILAIHITNHVLDLSPVVASLAREFGLHGVRVLTKGKGEFLQDSDWILLSRSSPVLKAPATDSELRDLDEFSSFPVWTDDYSNIVSLLK